MNSRGGSGIASGTTSWSANVGLQKGQNVITVTARDAVGNTTSDMLTVNYLSYDVNGDGLPDLMWHNTTTGANVIWYLRPESLIQPQAVSPAGDRPGMAARRKRRCQWGRTARHDLAQWRDRCQRRLVSERGDFGRTSESPDGRRPRLAHRGERRRQP